MPREPTAIAHSGAREELNIGLLWSGALKQPLPKSRAAHSPIAFYACAISNAAPRARAAPADGASLESAQTRDQPSR
eukprot:4929937-Prymnesium_polylepis.1